MKIFFWTIVGMLTGSLLLLALTARNSRLAAETGLREQRLRQERGIAELAHLEHRLAAFKADHERVTAALQVAKQKSKALAPNPNARNLQALRDAQLAFREGMNNDPQAQIRHFAARRAQHDENYGAFVKQLNLSEKDSESLLDNLVKRDANYLDLRVAVEKQRGSLSVEEIRKLRRQVEDDFRSAQLALLGDEGFRQFEYFQNTKTARQFVDRLAGNTTLVGAPISGQQADILIDTIAQANPQLRSGSIATLEEVEWDKVFSVASDILNDPQLKALETAAIPIWNKRRLEKLAAKSVASP